MEALARNKSLTKAAAEMNLTQSALTHRMKKLEGLLGTLLWEKDGKALRLTEAGELLRDAALRFESQFLELENKLKACGEGKRGKLRIGLECHPCYEILLEMISSFLKRWENVDIDVTRNFSFSGYRALLDHQVDAIITPDYIAYEGLEFHGIRDFELLLAVAPGHRLAETEFAVPSDLKNEVLFTYPIERERLDVFMNFLFPDGIRPAVHQTVEDTEIMLQLVSAGRGVSTFPDWIIDKHRQKYGVKGVRLGKNGIRKRLYAVTRTDERLPAYLSDFVTLTQSGQGPIEL